jgi:hypothetical protein
MEPVGIERAFTRALLRLKVKACARTAVSVGPVGTATSMAPEIRVGLVKAASVGPVGTASFMTPEIGVWPRQSRFCWTSGYRV